MKAQTLKNMPVVSMADGAKVGNVDEVLFDTTEFRIAALALQASDGQSILPFAAVRSIGADAVMVQSTAATEGVSGQTAREGFRGLSDLLGLPVVSGDGSILGEVADLEMDADGRLVEVEVRSGGILGIGVTRTAVAVAAIQMIGPKLITVNMPPSESAASPLAP